MSKKENSNLLSPLVDAVWVATTDVTKIVGTMACNAVGIKTEKQKEEDREQAERLMKAKLEQDKRDKEQEIENKNKIKIGVGELNFNDLFFNCGLKNKLKDMPVLEEVKHHSAVDIYSFKLPTGVTVTAVQDKIEHIADFFEVSKMNIKLQKKKGLMDIIITKDNLFNRVFSYQDMGLSDGLKMPIGHFVNQDYMEKMLVIDMAKDDIPHAFIGSTTGGGKSNFLRIALLNWIVNKTPEDIEIFLIDGKGGTDYVSFLDAPHIYMNKCFDSEEDIVTILEGAIIEILRRNKLFVDAKVNNFQEYIETGNKLPHRVIIFDEYAMYHGSSSYSAMQSKVGKICATGRSAGVHIIVATQDGRKEILDSMIKYNMPLKIGFKCDNAQHSKNISGFEGLENINKIGVGRVYGLPIDTEYIQFKTMKAPSSENIRKIIHDKYPKEKKTMNIFEGTILEGYQPNVGDTFGEECDD